MVARDHIVKTELKGGAQQRSRDQRQGRGIGPYDGHIRNDQKPRAYKPVIVAKAALCIGIRAAAAGKAVHQIVIVCRQQQHHKRADPQPQCGAHRPRERQERGAGHHESAPAHAAPEGQRPCAYRSQISAVFTIRADFRFVFHFLQGSFRSFDQACSYCPIISAVLQ